MCTTPVRFVSRFVLLGHCCMEFDCLLLQGQLVADRGLTVKAVLIKVASFSELH